MRAQESEGAEEGDAGVEEVGGLEVCRGEASVGDSASGEAVRGWHEGDGDEAAGVEIGGGGIFRWGGEHADDAGTGGVEGGVAEGGHAGGSVPGRGRGEKAKARGENSGAASRGGGRTGAAG